MATLNTTNIKHASSSTNNIVLNADGSTTISNLSVGPNRNLIINGDHRIAQRGTAAVTATSSASYKCVDRFKTDIDGSSGGDFSHAQSTDVPTGQGFTHSSKITTVTQASQPSGTSNKHQFYTMLEKQDVAHLEWGTSDAKTCTISFWVKSSVTGTYLFYLKYYGATDYSYYTNYTINSADTWEKKTITITGHTSGGKVSGTTDAGLMIEWGLGFGSGFETGTLNEWTTSTTQRLASGSVYLPEHSGATWYLTGCQFEVGSTATDYEFKSYAQELALCQRYYFNIEGDDDDMAGCPAYAVWHDVQWFQVTFPVPMRTIPSYTGSATAGRFYAHNSSNTFNFSQLTLNTNSNDTTFKSCRLINNGVSGTAEDGIAGELNFQADNGKLEFSAEL